MRPLDLPEFLEWLWIDACRYPGKYPVDADSFAREASEQISADCTAEYWELVDDLDKQCPETLDCSDDPAKAMRWIEAQLGTLDSVTEALEKMKFPGDIFNTVDDKVEYLVALVEDLQTELAALKAPAIILPDGRALEYDL